MEGEPLTQRAGLFVCLVIPALDLRVIQYKLHYSQFSASGPSPRGGAPSARAKCLAEGHTWWQRRGSNPSASSDTLCLGLR